MGHLIVDTPGFQVGSAINECNPPSYPVKRSPNVEFITGLAIIRMLRERNIPIPSQLWHYDVRPTPHSSPCVYYFSISLEGPWEAIPFDTYDPGSASRVYFERHRHELPSSFVLFIVSSTGFRYVQHVFVREGSMTASFLLPVGRCRPPHDLQASHTSWRSWASRGLAIGASLAALSWAAFKFVHI